MSRLLAIAYGVLAYVLFLGVLLWTVAFLRDLGVPRGIDDGARHGTATALATDLLLLGLFAVQHSVMARPAFKRRWTRVVPPAVERSTYVLATVAVLVLLLWKWQPLPHELWSVGPAWARALLWAGYGVGWAIVVASTFLIGHFDLFGLKQVLARSSYRAPGFREPGLYRLVRHPIMTGFLVAFWCAPDLSVGQLVFAAAASAYILVGVRFEEHDLRAGLGSAYTDYERRVPRFVPRPSHRRQAKEPSAVR